MVCSLSITKTAILTPPIIYSEAEAEKGTEFTTLLKRQRRRTVEREESAPIYQGASLFEEQLWDCHL
jgi:hypothetical protein